MKFPKIHKNTHTHTHINLYKYNRSSFRVQIENTLGIRRICNRERFAIKPNQPQYSTALTTHSKVLMNLSNITYFTDENQ